MVFGSVTAGVDVVKQIEALETVADKPVKDVVIEHCGQLESTEPTGDSDAMQTDEKKE